MIQSIHRIAAVPKATLAKKTKIKDNLAVYESASVYTESEVAWNSRERRWTDSRVNWAMAEHLTATDETLNCGKSPFTDWKLMLAVAEHFTATVRQKLMHATTTGLKKTAMAMLLLRMWGQAHIAPDLSFMIIVGARVAGKLLAVAQLAMMVVMIDTRVSEPVVIMMAAAHSRPHTMQGQACNNRRQTEIM